MWGRGYFCGTVGEVDEETIKHYIETQGVDETDENFKIVEEQLLQQNFQLTFSQAHEEGFSPKGTFQVQKAAFKPQ